MLSYIYGDLNARTASLLVDKMSGELREMRHEGYPFFLDHSNKKNEPSRWSERVVNIPVSTSRFKNNGM